MAPPIPSREALRALLRLCRSDTAPLRHYSSATRQSPVLSTRCSVQPRQPTHIPSITRSTRLKSTITEPPSAPGSQKTSDPQHDSSATLPDITNFYTLFPKTIPHGPPQPPSSIPTSNTDPTGHQPTSPFHINPRELRKEFLHLQSLYHPDKFPSGSTAHQRAYALSTLLNNAYRTLLDPLLRAQYILQLLYDVDVTTEDNSTHQSDPDTLMLVMDAQEDLESASNGTSADGKEGEEIVERLKGENQLRIRESERELGDAFEKGEVERARDWSVKLKYWKSLESGLNEWEPGKEIRLTH